MGSKKSHSSLDEAVAKIVSPPSDSAANNDGGDGERAPKPKATIKEKSQLEGLAKQIKDLHSNILRMQKKSTEDAVQIGKYLLRVKSILASINAGFSFDKWRSERCGISEGTAHNYMKLAGAMEKDPTIKDMGLNEAYYAIGLKKKQVVPAAATKVTDASTTTGNTTTGNVPGIEKIETMERRIGGVVVVREKGIYVAELESDWQKAVSELLADKKGFEEALLGGGLLIRVIPANPEFHDLEMSMATTSTAAQ